MQWLNNGGSMTETINIINSWIKYAAEKAPDKLPGFFLLLDYASLNFSKVFYIKHFQELEKVLISLDDTKADVKHVINYMRENHYE